MWKWISEFWVNTVIATVFSGAFVALVVKSAKWFFGGKKEKAKNEIETLNAEISDLKNKLFSMQKNGCKKEDEEVLVSLIGEKNRLVSEKEKYVEDSECEMKWLLISVVVLGGLAFVLSAWSEKNRVNNEQRDASGIEATEGVKNNMTEQPVESTLSPTPTPTVWIESGILPYPSFQEEGKTKYGDLTKYIGMTAGELIDLIGKPYEYQAIQDRGTGSTGGLWFDTDVVFTFCDSGKTLDMSCRVYTVWVQNHSGLGIAKNLGNGISANMNNAAISLALRDSLISCYSDNIQGGTVFGARCGDYLYDFYWGLGGKAYDFGLAPDRIIIYKHTIDDIKGAGSIEELINRYLWAYSFQDADMMLDLVFPQELDSIRLYFGMDRNEIAKEVGEALNKKREQDQLPIYFDLYFRHELSEERAPIDRDYDNLLKLYSYKHSRYKPEKIAIFDDVYLTTWEEEKYTLVDGNVVGLCFDGRWYIPSYFTGFWGFSIDEAYWGDKGYDCFHVK